MILSIPYDRFAVIVSITCIRLQPSMLLALQKETFEVFKAWEASDLCE